MKDLKKMTGAPLDKTSVFQLLCKLSNKYGVLFAFDLAGVDDLHIVFLASNGRLSIDKDNHTQAIGDGWGIFLFNTHTEMITAYYDFVGTDGPTPRNPYNGDFRIYAMTCDNTGKSERENT